METGLPDDTSNILPICSYCGNIRDGSGRWHPAETSVTQASLSHGICPSCYDREVVPLIKEGRG